tara:strand:+ start:132 stop:503 length:372 start_codon:yes stop_codon:yes gene_type:complete
VSKKYYNISEVSKFLGIEEHKIRYWDSIDPKTKKNRVEGISIKSKGGTRYFNAENINKLRKLKNILYEGEEQNHSLKLANKILLNKKDYLIENNYKNLALDHNFEKSKKINQILLKMKNLLKN